MSGEIVETDASGKTTVISKDSGHSLMPLADFPSREMAKMMHTPKTSELTNRLERIAVPTEEVGVPGRLTRNADGRAKYRRLYVTTAPIVEFASAKTAAVRDFYRAKQFGNPEYRRYKFETLQLRVGDALRPLPSCVQETAGTGFVVIAPVQCGKTALADALVRCFPKPFTIVNPPTEALSELHVFPIIRLKYPSNRSLSGLLKALRAAILEVTSDEHTKRSALSEMVEDESGDIAIATCILVNVGGLIIEGATGRKVHYVLTEEVMEFLVKVRDNGIPVTLMCTPAFMHGVKSYGSTYASIFDGVPLYLDPLKTSVQKGLASKESEISAREIPAEDTPSIETTFVKSFWQSGPSTKGKKMPRWLPQFVVDYCYGRRGWIAQCMEQLDIELGSSNGTPVEKWTKAYVEGVMKYRLKAMNPVRKVLGELERTDVISSKAKFLSYVDFLPNEVFELPLQGTWYEMLVTQGDNKNDTFEPPIISGP
ncbi:hypothetical protein [uncultured Herbaspirillum sp.]|uniref:hypothetical protein n=1 Tax=uncultured Herbaspirillum sp. TaxID=160236 RepID=UPI00258E0A89|nr:hypothetical protein [uncultured Herbaspirillum sp.]